MFNRKLKEKIELIEAKMRVQEKMCKKIERERICQHKELKFNQVEMGYLVPLKDSYAFLYDHDVVCNNCGKFIKTVRPQEKARMEYEQAKEKYNKVCGVENESTS